MSLFAYLAMQGCNCELRTDMIRHGEQCPIYLRERIYNLEGVLKTILYHPGRYNDVYEPGSYKRGWADGIAECAALAKKGLERQ